jgi:hypothetical protein
MCAGSKRKPPSHLLDGSTGHPSHPSSRAICALGLSAESPEQALTDARTAVSRQIRSRIESVLEDVVNIQVEGRRAALSEDYTAITLQSTEFEHNELIHQIDAILWRDEYRVYACLNRREAADAIINDLTPQIESIRRIHKAATEAAAEGDRAAFSIEFSAAVAERQKLSLGFSQLRIITGGQSALDQEVTGFLQKLYEEAGRLRKNVKIEIGPTTIDFPDDLANQLAGTLRQAVAQLRLNVGTENVECKEMNPEQYIISYSAEPNCRRGHLGYVCQPTLNLQLTHCLDNAIVGRHLIEDSSMKAGGTRDRESTLRKSLSQTTSDKLRPHLKELLKTALPIE